MNNQDLKKLILEIIRDGDGDADIFWIGQELEKRTDKFISSGTLFVSLRRMKEENLVTSEKRRSEPGRLFTHKTCYWLTGHGLAEINKK